MIDVKKLVSLTGLRLFASFLGIIYYIFQIKIFGTSPEIEIFFASSTIVYMLISLTQSGQLAEVLVPTYNKALKENGSQVANLFFSVILNYVLLILTILIFVFYKNAKILRVRVFITT